MRYLVQLLIPAAIIVLTIVILVRARRARTDGGDGTGEAETPSRDAAVFTLILLVGGTVAAITFIALGEFWA